MLHEAHIAAKGPPETIIRTEKSESAARVGSFGRDG